MREEKRREEKNGEEKRREEKRKMEKRREEKNGVEKRREEWSREEKRREEWSREEKRRVEVNQQSHMLLSITEELLLLTFLSERRGGGPSRERGAAEDKNRGEGGILIRNHKGTENRMEEMARKRPLTARDSLRYRYSGAPTSRTRGICGGGKFQMRVDAEGRDFVTTLYRNCDMFNTKFHTVRNRQAALIPRKDLQADRELSIVVVQYIVVQYTYSIAYSVKYSIVFCVKYSMSHEPKSPSLGMISTATRTTATVSPLTPSPLNGSIVANGSPAAQSAHSGFAAALRKLAKQAEEPRGQSIIAQVVLGC
ncbi:hypothetical protein QTP86_011087 [Hemibagrus guttatus]|nr:hypothetical protein QTP86_011087 [Hemibagrus guttatus]